MIQDHPLSTGFKLAADSLAVASSESVSAGGISDFFEIIKNVSKKSLFLINFEDFRSRKTFAVLSLIGFRKVNIYSRLHFTWLIM